MAYAATAGGSLPSMTAPPGVLALQRAMVWLVGASGAIVFIEPSPYELATLAAALIFFATGLRMRLVFVPLLLLLFLINIGYSISAVAVMDRPNVPNWIATPGTWRSRSSSLRLSSPRTPQRGSTFFAAALLSSPLLRRSPA